MDSRLKMVNGQRLTHLLHSDAPRVAQAMVDALRGRAKLFSGLLGSSSYLEFVYPGVYSVVICGDDWRRIFPFVRYGSASFSPVIPPAIQPERVRSPHPNRNMNPPPKNPGDGFTSFLAFFSWDEYTRIQRLLAISSVGQWAKAPSYKTLERVSDPVWLNPPSRQTDQFGTLDVYGRLVGMLQQLFPTDFPTSRV